MALYWIRLFRPLLAKGVSLPQMPGNRGLEGLGFVRPDGFPQLMNVSDTDLRVGMRIAEDRRNALHRALRDARRTIIEMPVKHLNYHDGRPIFPTKGKRLVRAPVVGRLDAPYLWSFGEFSLPRHLWRALQRYNVWVEPALVAEWMRLMNEYAKTQGRKLDQARVAQSMVWSEPDRAATIPRERAFRLLEQGPLYCVWSGRRISGRNLDIDHCFPWSSWPCNDLWNLLPASRVVNQGQKRDQLPADLVLRRAKGRIIDWWDSGYVRAENRLITEQFALEASSTLPALEIRGASVEEALSPSNLHRLLEDVFSAVSLQRLRLRNDQRIPEWDGPADRSQRPGGAGALPSPEL